MGQYPVTGLHLLQLSTVFDMKATETTTTPERAAPWTFVLCPTGKSNDPLSERVAMALRHAESRGITVTLLRLDLDASDCNDAEAVRVRTWLKRVLRDHGLKASWPTEDE